MTLFNNTISVVRTQGTFIDGIWQECFSVDETVSGSVQVVSGEEFTRLPEGRKQFGVVKIYTDSDLKASELSDDSTGDVILFDGRKWEIYARLPYANGLISHNKYLASLVVEVSNA